jgi:hypothetical protein
MVRECIGILMMVMIELYILIVVKTQSNNLAFTITKRESSERGKGKFIRLYFNHNKDIQFYHNHHKYSNTIPSHLFSMILEGYTTLPIIRPHFSELNKALKPKHQKLGAKSADQKPKLTLHSCIAKKN